MGSEELEYSPKKKTETSFSNWSSLRFSGKKFPPMIYHLFGFDLRSIALFRVSVSILILVDLWNRSYYIHDHYSTWAVWPISAAIDSYYIISLHFISGAYWYQASLFILQACGILMQLVGWHTRKMSVFNWLMMLSLHNRNLYLLDGGDDFIRMYLFWAMFLPLGDRYSIDSLLVKKSQSEKAHGERTNENQANCGCGAGCNYHLSWGTVGAWVQFLIIYEFTAYLKWAPEWQTDLTATYYALGLDHFVTRFGKMMMHYPRVLMFLTWAVLKFEKIGPVLFISPVWNGVLRSISVLGFWGLHFGFGLCLNLGMFIWTPGVCAFLFLPSWYWDWFIPYVSSFFFKDSNPPLTPSQNTTPNVCPLAVPSQAKNYPTIYVRGENNWRAVMIYRMFFLFNRAEVISIPDKETQNEQSAKTETNSNEIELKEMSTDDSSEHVNIKVEGWEKSKEQDSKDVLVFEHKGSCTKGYLAVVSLVQNSPLLWFLTPLFLSYKGKVIFETAGNIAANIEQKTDTLKKVYPTTPYRYRKYLVQELIAIFFICFITNWNFATFYKYEVSPKVYWLAPTLKIDQWWGMFAPNPPKDGGWIAIHGVLGDGRLVDVYKGHGQPTNEKPELFSEDMPSQRWRTYLLGLLSSRNADKRIHYGRYLCREWNWWDRHTGNDMLKSFKIIYFSEETLFDLQVATPVTITLWDHQCY
eukprot:TRINITY_DN14980_c0_g1_i1.p1 TRINITY_DN14980_c0_g1~~TRINITY_DN14980_c0_g1_i1.p1  ORF type:complete len:695 (+),score=116.68 TRINITY_DN14980_c0_g1_i1:222-2306(+)